MKKYTSLLVLAAALLSSTTAFSQTAPSPTPIKHEAAAPSDVDVTKDPAFIKMKSDLEAAQASVAEANSIIQACQAQRDQYSQAFSNEQVRHSLDLGKLQAAIKEIEDLKAKLNPAPTPAPTPTPAARK